jgi:hypothetical protein
MHELMADRSLLLLSCLLLVDGQAVETHLPEVFVGNDLNVGVTIARRVQRSQSVGQVIAMVAHLPGNEGVIIVQYSAKPEQGVGALTELGPQVFRPVVIECLHTIKQASRSFFGVVTKR